MGGIDGAKRVSDLFEEIRSGKCACVADPEWGGQTVRIACVLRIKVHAVCNGQVKVLHETETQTWFKHAGQVLRMPAKLLKPNQFDSTLEDLWYEKFGLCVPFVNDNFTRFGVEIFAEEKLSASYPGLRCVYIVHEVPYWACEPIVECEALGLPEGNTVERSAPRWPDGHMETSCYVWITQDKDEAAQRVLTSASADEEVKGIRRLRSAPTIGEEKVISMQSDVQFGHYVSLPV